MTGILKADLTGGNGGNGEGWGRVLTTDAHGWTRMGRHSDGCRATVSQLHGYSPVGYRLPPPALSNYPVGDSLMPKAVVPWSRIPEGSPAMNPIILLLLLLGLLAALIAMPDHSSEPQAPPRYRLEVGQELIYEGSSRFKFQNGSHATKDKTTFWVTRKNDDGSWHIVAHNENTFSESRGNADDAQSPGRKEEAFGAFDLY